MGENNSRIVRTTATYLLITLLLLGIYFGREILFPVLMAILFAILLRPLVLFLHTRLRFPHMIAVSLAVFLGMAIILGTIYFLSSQVATFMNDLPAIKKNILIHLHHLQHWIQGKFRISSREQQEYMESTMGGSKMITTDSLGSITGGLINFLLIPFYTFLILMYRTLFLKFLMRVTAAEHHQTLAEIVLEVKSVVRSYIVGLMLELIIVAAMTSIGLWMIGVEYFIFLGLLTAVLNLIPYIGILVACAVSVLVAMSASTELSAVLGVVGVNVFVQLVDNNILMPRIVGSKVSINAFVSILAVIIGGHLAGVAGMFLAIPVVAIMKVIFDRIDYLKPYGMVMGDNIPKTFNWKNIRLPDFNAGARDDTEAKEEAREIL